MGYETYRESLQSWFMPELWYPSLRPPRQDLVLSLLYGDGFASVVPSFRLRDSHSDWEDLEHLQRLGLYEPLRLADALSDPATAAMVPVQLQALAHRANLDREASPLLAEWSRRAIEPSSFASAPHWQWPADPRPDVTADSFRLDLTRPADSDLADRLVEAFAFTETSGGLLSAPREVVDEVVRTAVVGISYRRPGLVPTTHYVAMSGSSAPGPTGGQLAWAFRLPAPPEWWTLREALAFRDDYEAELARVRSAIAAARVPTDASAAEREAETLSRALRRDLLVLHRALDPHAGRSVGKRIAVALGTMALGAAAAAAAPDFGVFDDLGVDVALTLGDPSISGPAMRIAYAKLIERRRRQSTRRI